MYYLKFLFVPVLFLVMGISSCNLGKQSEEPLVGNEIKDSLGLAEYMKSTDRSPNTVEYYLPIWSYYSRTANYQKIIDVTLPFYHRSKENGYEDGIVYSSAYMAQIYLHYGSADSLRIYLDEIIKHDIRNQNLRILINSIEGIYALRYELDYARAMSYFMDSYRLLKGSNQPERMVINLCNISVIYVLRGDPLGYRYAREALDLCRQYNLDSHFQSISLTSVSEMLLLNRNYNNALEKVIKAEKLMEENGLDYMLTSAYTLHAKIFRLMGAKEEAEKYIAKAEKYMDKAQSGDKEDFYFNNGELYREMSENEKALENYFRMLRMSYKYMHMEYRGQTLMGISKVYENKGDKDLAYAYMKAFSAFKDSILNVQKERDFNNYQLLLQKSEHEKKMQDKEIDLLKANRKMIIILAVFIIFVIVAVFIFISIVRQNRAYAQLVKLHQQNLYKTRPEFVSESMKIVVNEEEEEQEKLDAASAGETVTESESTPAEEPAEEESDYTSREIYDRIEDLMKTQKIYTDKDLTLDKVATLLNTNRSYVSRAINKYSGLGFFNYINYYRINEATRILSESDIPLKQLCDDVGFISMSTFYRAFQKETGCPPSKYRTELKKLKTTR